MAKLYRSGNASSGSLSSNSSTSLSTVSNQSGSSAKSWNTSKVSKKTKKALEQAETPFSSKYSDYLDRAMKEIETREDFSYDLNADALYQQYANQYKAMGEQAMNETMASASAMTGGYGNSYAVSAGQQAYNDYLQQLSNVAPDLYGQARDIYDAETNEMYEQANMYAGLEAEDYAKWSADREYYANKFDSEWARNAVSHSKQDDWSKQTSKSSSSSSSSSTNYTKNPNNLEVPSQEAIEKATKSEKNARDFMTAWGLDGNIVSKSKFLEDGKIVDGEHSDTYRVYLAKTINKIVDDAYTKKERKKSQKDK